MTAPGSGNWFCCIFGVAAILMGATAASALVIGARISTLADFDSYSVAPAVLVNNATIMVPICFVSPALQSNFVPGPSAVNLTLNPTAQAVTFKGVGSRIMMFLFRGPDA